MTADQIQQVVGNGKKLAAIITTRNATFWLVDAQGRDSTEPDSGARYSVVEWDDANELAVVKVECDQIRSDQFRTIQYLNYGSIDELVCIDA